MPAAAARLGRLHRQRRSFVLDQALLIGQRLQQALHLGSGSQRIGTVVVVGGQPSQRRIEFRRQQQAEQARPSVGTVACSDIMPR